ncbi:hypothetical protein B0H13DRAFT_2371683 [Mycena leptocephala]|nr:hypothetical protein B0H13DRAFT_2371683 [Mycena leptocephala]
MTPVLRPHRLQAAPHPDFLLVSLADISPFPASALPPRLTLLLTPNSPAPLPTPGPLVHPCSPRKRRVVLLSRPCGPRESLRIQPEVSKHRVVVAASSNIGTVLARWHNPAYTLFPPGTARARVLGTDSSDPPPNFDRSLCLSLSLHLHLSLPPPPPPPLVVLLRRPTHLSPRPPASHIVGNPD